MKFLKVRMSLLHRQQRQRTCTTEADSTTD